MSPVESSQFSFDTRVGYYTTMPSPPVCPNNTAQHNTTGRPAWLAKARRGEQQLVCVCFRRRPVPSRPLGAGTDMHTFALHRHLQNTKNAGNETALRIAVCGGLQDKVVGVGAENLQLCNRRGGVKGARVEGPRSGTALHEYIPEQLASYLPYLELATP